MAARRDELRRQACPAALALAAAICSCSPPAPPAGRGQRELSPDLEPFLRSYFATWSSGDMRAYGEHFHRDAVISFVKDGEIRSSLPRDRFVALQAASRARSEAEALERMTGFTAEEDDQAATVVAQWELTKGKGDQREVTRGVDRFTLIRDGRGRWKIAALVYYSTD